VADAHRTRPRRPRLADVARRRRYFLRTHGAGGSEQFWLLPILVWFHETMAALGEPGTHREKAAAIRAYL